MVPAQSAKYRVSAGRRSCALSHVDGQVDQSGLHGKPLATPNLDSLGENARETCDVGHTQQRARLCVHSRRARTWRDNEDEGSPVLSVDVRWPASQLIR